MSNYEWLTSVLVANPAAVTQAALAYHETGGTDEGVLAARHLLDAALRAGAGWPRDDDYLRLADVFAARGDVDLAALLRKVATTGPLAEEAMLEWGSRYADRTSTPRQDLARWLTDRGHIDFDPDGPYRGIDGALYQPGVIAGRRQDQPVTVVTSRGASEVIRGWASYEQMRQWIASRGSTGSGDLGVPPPAAASRLAREERVLAHLLFHRKTMPEITRVLPAVTFTADVRYDLYAALLTASDHGVPCTEPELRQEFTRRLSRLPPAALRGYGDTAGRYLRRLEATTAGHDEATTAAQSLREEDRHAVRTRAYRVAEPGRPAKVAGLLTGCPAAGQEPGPPEPRM